MEQIEFSKLKPYFEQIPGLIIIDMQGKVIYLND